MGRRVQARGAGIGMFCGRCGREIPQDEPFCRRCGAPGAEHHHAPAADAPDGDVYALLYGANLARLRRQYHEAASVCVDVLRRQPRNPTAHSLLGDIYRDQGLPRDAIEWYKLALELDPGNRADREKLDQLIDRVYGPPDDRRAPREWFLPRLGKRICAALRCAELARPVRLGMAVTLFVLLALFIALLAYRASLTPSVGSPSTDATPAASTSPAPPVPEVAGPAPSSPPPENPGGGAPAQAGPGRKPGSSAPVVKQPYTSGLAAREQQLLGALRAAAIRGERPRAIDSVTIDPRTQAATIEFLAPELATPTASKRNLILIALALAEAALRADPALTSVTARGALPIPDARGKRSPEYAFVGEIGRGQLTERGAAPLSPDRALERFSNVWWHPLYRDLVP